MKTSYFLVFLLSFSLSCFFVLLILGSANLKELGRKTVSNGVLILGQTTLGPVDELVLTEIEDKLGYGGDIFSVELDVEGEFSKAAINKEVIRYYGFKVIGEDQ